MEDQGDLYHRDSLALAKALSLSEAECHVPGPEPKLESVLSPNSRSPPVSTFLDSDELFKVTEQQNDEITRLKRRIRILEGELRDKGVVSLKDLQGMREYKRRRGKKLTDEERRAVKHTIRHMFEEQGRGSFVKTKNPFLRAATYLGIAEATVRAVYHNKGLVDRRGKHVRFSNANLFGSDLRHYVNKLNLAGRPATLNRLRKYVVDTWPNTKIPSKETIRRIMVNMGFSYQNVKRAKAFVDTKEIKDLRRAYLKLRHSDELKDSLFIWLDESYCNQHHVDPKVCTSITIIHIYSTYRVPQA